MLRVVCGLSEYSLSPSLLLFLVMRGLGYEVLQEGWRTDEAQLGFGTGVLLRPENIPVTTQQLTASAHCFEVCCHVVLFFFCFSQKLFSYKAKQKSGLSTGMLHANCQAEALTGISLMMLLS